MLGGRVAEEMVFDDVTNGAVDDLDKVTKLARAMVTQYGMSEKMGPMVFGQRQEMVFLGRDIGEQRNYSELVAREIDKEVRRIVAEAHDRADDILTRYGDLHETIARKLIQVETLDAEEFEAFFAERARRPAACARSHRAAGAQGADPQRGRPTPAASAPGQAPNPRPAPA